jgi:hypothetical protein
VKVAKARSGRWGASAQVRSNAPHAHFFEYGTQARQTDLGYNRGPMPGKNVLVPIVQRRRLRMYDALAGMVERAGFTVRE